MPPARAWWAALYAFVTSFATAIAAQYAQLAGTQASIGKGAWIVAGCGALVVAFGAGKAAWPVEEGRLHG